MRRSAVSVHARMHGRRAFGGGHGRRAQPPRDTCAAGASAQRGQQIRLRDGQPCHAHVGAHRGLSRGHIADAFRRFRQPSGRPCAASGRRRRGAWRTRPSRHGDSGVFRARQMLHSAQLVGRGFRRQRLLLHIGELYRRPCALPLRVRDSRHHRRAGHIHSRARGAFRRH